MDFSPESEGSRSLAGLSVAVLAHLLLGYALVTGLAQKGVKVLKDSLDVALLEEQKPQVDKPVPPPPRHAPPPVYVPPPEVETRAPVVETVTAVVTTPPPPVVEAAPVAIAPPVPPVKAPVVEAPPPPPVVVPVVVPVAAPVVALGSACPNHVAVRSKVDYPQQAALRGLNGDVLIELTVLANGEVANAHVVKSTNPIFDDTAITAVTAHLHCVAQGQEVRVRIPFNFRIDH